MELRGRKWRREMEKIHNWRLHNFYSPYDDEESEEVKEDEKTR